MNTFVNSTMRTFILSLLATIIYDVMGADKTVMLIEFARHGTRVPFSSVVEKVPDWMKQYPLVEVTGVGLRQHYNLGKEIGVKFADLFDGIKYSDIYVRSTRIQRTIGSATAHLMGISDMFPFEPLPFLKDDHRAYPPYTSMDMNTMTFSTGLPNAYTPLPIYSASVDQEEFVHELSEGSCPVGYKRANELFNKMRDDLNKNQKFVDLTIEACKALGVNCESHGTKFDVMTEMSDFIGLDWRNNPNPILPRSHPLYGPIRRQIDLYCTYQMLDPVLKKVTSAPMLLEVLTRFQRKIKGTEFVPKYIYYSTHDTVLAPMLHTLEQLDAECYLKDVNNANNATYCGVFPDTAASVIFELFKNSTGYFMRFYYNLEKKKLWGKTEMTVEEFDTLLGQRIDRNYRNYCRTQPGPSPAPTPTPSTNSDGGIWKTLGVICIVLFVLQLFGGIGYYFYRKSQEGNKPSKPENTNSYLQVEDAMSSSREESP